MFFNVYKEQQKDCTKFVLLKESNFLGTYENLKKVGEFLQNKGFYSYNTLIRKREFPIL